MVLGELSAFSALRFTSSLYPTDGRNNPGEMDGVAHRGESSRASSSPYVLSCPSEVLRNARSVEKTRVYPGDNALRFSPAPVRYGCRSPSRFPEERTADPRISSPGGRHP